MPYSFSDPGYPAYGTHDYIGPVPNFAPAGATVTPPPAPEPLVALHDELAAWQREVLAARRAQADLPLMASERRRLDEIAALLRPMLAARGLTRTPIRPLPPLALSSRSEALPTVTDCLDAIATLRTLPAASGRFPQGE